MNKIAATAKAHALANDFMRPYAVVKMHYGYDAEQYNTLISPAELVEIVQPAPLTPENNTEARQQADDEAEQAQDNHCPEHGDYPGLECPACADSDLIDDDTPDDYAPMFDSLDDVAASQSELCEAYDRSLRAQLDAKRRETSRQSHMFAATNADLPLFSGTAPRGQAQTFNPPAADSHRQAKLF